MKRLQIIALLLLAILAACTPHYEGNAIETRYGTSLPLVASPEMQSIRRTQLSAIDSLMWQQPDSALACLLSYFDTCRDVSRNVLETTNGNLSGDVSGNVSTDYDRHYAQLLLAELLYKNDYVQTNRNELLQAVEYFDSLVIVVDEADTRGVSLHGSGRGDASHASAEIVSAKTAAFLDARAHYINGVGYYENDSMVEACEEYLKALKVMEVCFEEEELVGKKANFMALTYTHLTDLFSGLYLHEQAIFFGKKSLEYYDDYDASPLHIAWVLNNIGSHYDMMDINDSAYLFYNEALQILPDINNITYRDVETHLAVLSYKTGTSSGEALNLLYSIINKSESDKEYYSRCMNIGEIFYREAQFDSSWFYLDNVFRNTLNENSKKQAAEWLVEICKIQGKDSEMIEYAVFLVPFANKEENNSTIKSQLTEQYKDYIQRKHEYLHHQEKIKNIRWFTVIVISISILLSYIIILYHRNKNKKQHLETQIESERQAHKMQQKALSGKLKKSKEALHEALQQINNNSANNKIHSDSKQVQNFVSFVKTPICSHILETVRQQYFKSKVEYRNYKEHALQKEHILALRVAADEYMNDFTIRLQKRYHDLTDEDVTYCCLYLLDITDADIAALMQKAYPTVCERRRKIKRIVGGENNLCFTLRNFSL